MRAFEEQKQYVKELSDVKATGKTVAFFYVTTAGTVSVRKSNDYVPKMIDIAGGEYVFQNLKGEDNADFQCQYADGRILCVRRKTQIISIYNSTIDGQI